MRKLILIISFGITILGLNAQIVNPELVSSSGDSFSNVTYQLDWSVGECITSTHDTGDYLITQGFHQNAYVITTVEDLRTDIEISVYPNPTCDFIILDFQASESLGNVSLIDSNGKVLQISEIKSDLEQINFLNYVAGIYFILISQDNQLVKTFKIIKK